MTDTPRIRFSKTEFLTRQQKVRNQMVKKNIELLIVTDPANMYWLTGYDSWSFYVHQCVVITQDSLFWFGRALDAPSVKLTTFLNDSETVPYDDSYVQSAEKHPMQYLASILKNRKLPLETIGIEKDNYYFSARAAESLYASLPDSNFVDATALVNWQRAIKSEKEISYMKIAGSIIEKIYQRIVKVAKPGMRKNELAAEIQYASALGTDEHFGDYISIAPLFGHGEEASAAHMTWDGAVLQNNTGTFLELAAAHARYHCPCSRTLYFGKVPQKYIEVEKVILEATQITLEKFKPGNTCAEVADTFNLFLNKHGYEKDNRCGYPIGASYPPDWGERTMSLRSEDKTLLKENMTFHFMPALWFDDWGYETTESIIVTKNGGECLSSVPRHLLVKN